MGEVPTSLDDLFSLPIGKTAWEYNSILGFEAAGAVHIFLTLMRTLEMVGGIHLKVMMEMNGMGQKAMEPLTLLHME